MQFSGIKIDKDEEIRRKGIDGIFTAFILLAVLRLFVFYTFINLPSLLELFITLSLGGLMLCALVLSIPDLPRGVKVLWIGLIASLGVSYLTHFTGLEYACNTVIFLGTITLLPQISLKARRAEVLLVSFAIYVTLLGVLSNRAIGDTSKPIYINPNGASFVFMLYQCMLIAYARRQKRAGKIFLYALALLTVYVQFGYGGRSSFIGTGLLFFYVILQKFFDKFTRRKIKWLTVELCIGGIVFAYFYAVVLYTVVGDDWIFLGKDIFTGREQIWLDAFAQIKGHWFFGIGHNLQSIPINGDFGATNLHNQMMGYFITFGLFSAIFYALLLGVLTARVGKTSRKTLVATIIVLLVNSYFDTVLYSTANMVYLPIALTAIYAFDVEKEKEREMVIHYCWLGGKKKSDKIKYCIETWKKKCPDAKIVEWNEKNYDVYKNAYTAKAYEEGKYAFVSDYMRFDILFCQGGVYLDTDVELLKDISPLLQSPFMGFERAGEVAPGLIMYAEKGEALFQEILAYYAGLDDFSADKTVVEITTEILKKHGLKKSDSVQTVAGFTIYPTEYFNPKGGDYGKEKITKNTYSIHHYEASWKSPLDRLITRYKVKYGVKKGKILFTLRHPIQAVKKWIMKK